MAISRDPLSRRDFNLLLALATPTLALTDALAEPFGRAVAAAPSARGIRELRLLATDLPAQRDFYSRKLGLPVVEESGERVTIQAGGTRLSFEKARAVHGTPMYHFAFNIPENKLELARRWLADRTPVAANQAGREVFHFPTWNAHSIYFYDAVGNLGELIARHNLPNATAGPFSEREILYASEIGLVVDDVPGEVAALRSGLGLEVYRPGSPELVPVGDEHQLLIVVPRGRPWMGRTHASVYPTAAAFAGAPPARYTVGGFPYELSLT
ncbi:MAG TPA: VOC family protein [Thermoanaerobaculia bacterium]|nr:VOC family protein [Thermoanaerobaculia bacterium]